MVGGGGGGSGLEGPFLCLSFPAAESSGEQPLEDLQQDHLSTGRPGASPAPQAHLRLVPPITCCPSRICLLQVGVLCRLPPSHLLAENASTLTGTQPPLRQNVEPSLFPRLSCSIMNSLLNNNNTVIDTC